MGNRYDWGIYTGKGGEFNYKDKSRNIDRYVDEMLNKSLIMFKYEGLPDTIPQIELEKLLQVGGYAIITEVEGELYAMRGGLGGKPDAYGRPTQIVVNNVGLDYNATLDIGKDCIVIKNDYLGSGLVDMFTKYSTMLVENDITMIIANMNKRVDNLISVADDMTSESARLYLKKIQDGEMGYIMENKLFESLKSHNVRGNSSVNLNELFQYHQYLKGSMMNEIGLNTAFNMKKERLITSEIEETTDGLYPLIDNMMECRQQSLDLINEKYGTNITIELNSSWGARKEKERLLLQELEDEKDEVENVRIEDGNINSNDGIDDNEIQDEEVEEETEEEELIEDENIDEEVEEKEEEEEKEGEK